MINKYLIRLDDACPTMDATRWQRMEEILDRYGIRPMVGVIPANADPTQMIDESDNGFWGKIRMWEKKGWAIALHGYDHCYISKERGINPLWPRSEFAGVPLEKQKEKISKGIEIFASHGISPKYFFAPSHTFDENTLEALRLESDIRIISDTIADRPYRCNGFIFIPQLGGMPRKMLFEPKIRTFCLHPSTMADASFIKLEEFLTSHNDKFIGFDELNLDMVKEGKSLLSRFISTLYFSYRNLKSIK